MCGITGFIDLKLDKNETVLTQTVRGMADAIRHRGPDSDGMWCDPANGIAFGHRRLAIVDLSPGGHQPMDSANGRYVITYNGEIYNFPEIRAHFADHNFKGSSDTEILLLAIERWGLEKALQEINGMYAFALWDRQEKTLHLVRDRVGKKPLYYGWCGDVFLFGSELKALRAHPAFVAEIDREALSAYTRHNYVPAPWSIYKGIQKLPAASVLSINPANDRQGRLHCYWDIESIGENLARNPRNISLDAATDELDEILGQAVSGRMLADVPLGAFLSGGIDSSLVTALMQKHSTQAVKTYSIGFGEQAFNEAENAKVVARHLGTEHTEFYVTVDEARSVIPSLPSMFDEPFADSSQIPTWHVAHLARKHVTVALSGDGGDESFAGYGRYHMVNKIADPLFQLPEPLRSLIGRGAKMAPFSGKPRRLFETIGASDRDDFYRRIMTYWRSEDHLLVHEGEAVHAMNDPARIPGMEDYIHRMMMMDTIAYLPDDILVKVDRATMDVALEARAPLLDKNVIEFAWSLPLDLKYSNGTGKIILRNLLKRYVPETMFNRPKQGFSVPVAEWLRGPLKDWADDLLSAERLKDGGYFNPNPVRKRWARHLSGQDDYSQNLWGILMFQAWLK
ncbi:MAG: asparagine synthase [Micavibrio sp.]|nr:asparagine synthase [Micavibrio sp.]